MKQVSLDYTEGFSCLAGSCPDTCCKDWEIILDERRDLALSENAWGAGRTGARGDDADGRGRDDVAP